MLREVEEYQGDTALIGTAAHAGAEYACLSVMHGVEPSIDMAIDLARKELEEGWNSPRLQRTEYATLGAAFEVTRQMVGAWFANYYPIVSDFEIAGAEVQFSEPAIVTPERVICIEGTSDLWLTNGTVIDWKFPGRKYSGSDAWKYERYDPQPTFYLWARLLKDLHWGWEEVELAPVDHPLPDFTFGLTIRPSGEPDELDIRRHIADIHFLAEELRNLATLIEARLTAWPLGATDWHCSPKWCAAWSRCRGSYVGDDPWGLMERLALKLGPTDAVSVSFPT